MFNWGLRRFNKLQHITKLSYSIKNSTYHQTGIDYLKLSLNRSIENYKDLYSKTNSHYHDYNLLKLCQVNNVDINHVTELDPTLTNKLMDYKLPKKVYVGLSSGIDSTFCAAVLSQIYPGEVHGIYMQNWGDQQESSIGEGKCYEKDIKELESLLKKDNALDVKDFHVKSFEKEYWISVFEPFLEGYKNGETPNPDISCNSLIKFDALVKYIDNVLEKGSVDKDYLLVMGHYCKRMNKQGIFIAEDVGKDQSYYLSKVEPTVFQRVWFPLGHILKKECREFAKDFGLANFKKKDSVGICFVENEKVKNTERISRTQMFTRFLSDYIEEYEGHIVSHLLKEEVFKRNGKVVTVLENFVHKIGKSDKSDKHVKIYWKPKHKGVHTYTLGQRVKAILPQSDEFDGRWYVSKKDVAHNELEVVVGKNNPLLYKRVIHFKDILYQDKDAFQNSKKVAVKFRSLHLSIKSNPKQLVEIDGIFKDNAVYLSERHIGINKGQYLVFYDFYTGQVLMNSKISSKKIDN